MNEMKTEVKGAVLVQRRMSMVGGKLVEPSLISGTVTRIGGAGG